MNDFQKALGIMEKAKQMSMFEKPRVVIGQTSTGKPMHFDSHMDTELTPDEHGELHERHDDLGGKHDDLFFHFSDKGDKKQAGGHWDASQHHFTVSEYHDVARSAALTHPVRESDLADFRGDAAESEKQKAISMAKRTVPGDVHNAMRTLNERKGEGESNSYTGLPHD